MTARSTRTSTEELLTRSEVGKLLKVAKTTVPRWEATGKLRPIVDDRNRRLFHVDDVQDIAAQRASSAGATSDARLAAKIFAALDAGEHPVELVIKHEAHPDVVEALQRQWARMRAAFVVAPDVVRAIERLPTWDGDVPIRDGDQLFESLRHTFTAGPRRCFRCHDATATLCTRCLKKRLAATAAKVQQGRVDEAPDLRDASSGRQK